MKLQRPARQTKLKRLLWGALIATSVLCAVVAIRLFYSQTVINAPAATRVSDSAASEKTLNAQTTDSNKKETVVPAWQPVSLTIATVGVQAAPVFPVGVTPGGEMEAPDSIHEVGWYSKSASPADDSGALLLDGHVGLEGQSAVFRELHRLRTGSIIKVTAQNGSVYSYEVYHVEQMPLEDVDMRKMLRSVNPSKQGLNIITCAGDYDTSRSTYDDRVLVYAVRV